VRPLRECLDGVDRPEGVRDEVRADDLDGSLARERLERVELQLTLGVDRDGPEARPGPLSDVLPRHEVRVVLELGDDDDVAGTEVVEAPGVCDEVERLGRAAGEDDLLLARRVEERGDRPASRLEPLRRALREPVDAAMDVRVLVLVEVAHAVEHLPRLLRRRRRVEVGDRPPAAQLFEHREVRSQLMCVERGKRRRGHCSHRSHGRPADGYSPSALFP
jgi:hypothetical protein